MAYHFTSKLKFVWKSCSLVTWILCSHIIKVILRYLPKHMYTMYFSGFCYGNCGFGGLLWPDLYLPFHITPPTGATCPSLYSLSSATFVIRLLIITNFIVTVTTFYFCTVFIYTAKIDTVSSSLVTLFCTTLHMEGKGKDFTMFFVPSEDCRQNIVIL